MPGYSNVQGMYAYALEECGEYAEAERWGREASARNPGDLWAIHSVAHVLEMQGRYAEGSKWLDYPAEHWAKKNFFKAHVWWHNALFSLAQEDFGKALNIFDSELSSVNSDKYVDVSNQAALLKRLEIAGVDVGDLVGRGALGGLVARARSLGQIDGLLGVAAILGACADLAVAPRAGADGDSGVTGDPPAVGDREPGREPGQVDSRGLALAGVALVVVGLVLRYPVQHELKTLWWFGPWG